MADNKPERLEIAQQTRRIPGKDELVNISTSDLEELIGELLDAGTNYDKLNELLEEYETRDGVPHVDVGAADTKHEAFRAKVTSCCEVCGAIDEDCRMESVLEDAQSDAE